MYARSLHSVVRKQNKTHIRGPSHWQNRCLNKAPLWNIDFHFFFCQWKTEIEHTFNAAVNAEDGKGGGGGGGHQNVQVRDA